MKDLDPLLPSRVKDVIDSGVPFLQNTQKLKSLLEIIPIPENAMKVLEGIGETVQDVSFLQWCRFLKLTTDLSSCSSIH